MLSNTKDMRVVILAGGKGTRLRPYTAVFPKPLVPIGDMPILEVVLRRLKAAGFQHVTLAVNHLSNLISAFFQDGASLGLKIEYCSEDSPLGTAGSLALVENITDTFLVMNGDLLTTFDFHRIIDLHHREKSMATLGVFPREVKVDFGVLDVNAEGELVGYREKPVFPYLVSMGISVFSRGVLEFIPRGKPLDIPDLILELKKAGKKVMTCSDHCEWLDIGRADDYEQAVERFEQDRNKYLGC